MKQLKQFSSAVNGMNCSLADIALRCVFAVKKRTAKGNFYTLCGISQRARRNLGNLGKK